MNSDKYINFNEAVEILNTTRSTLYKWLQAGKIPGHKLGSQWRFCKDELFSFLNNNDSQRKLQESTYQLNQFFDHRNNTARENHVNAQTVGELAEKLLWDAVNTKASGVHIQPNKNQYSLFYRFYGEKSFLEQIAELDKNLFEAIINYWNQISTPTTSENNRRFFLNREQDGVKESLQVRFQQLNTVQGQRVTLKILATDQSLFTLKAAVHDTKSLKQFNNWSSKPYGIIVISGRVGSGKTTTIYCTIQELLKKKRMVCSMETPIEIVMEGTNQVEVDFNDMKNVAKTFDALMESDFDVMCLGLASPGQRQELIEDLALRSAMSGHLVLLQIESNSIKNTMEQLNHKTNGKFEEYLVGISWQKLVKLPNDKGYIAKYEMQDGKLASEDLKCKNVITKRS